MRKALPESFWVKLFCFYVVILFFENSLRQSILNYLINLDYQNSCLHTIFKSINKYYSLSLIRALLLKEDVRRLLCYTLN